MHRLPRLPHLEGGAVMNLVRVHELYSHAPVLMRGQQLPKLLQSKSSLVDLNDCLAVFIELDLTAQDRALWNPLVTSSKIFDLGPAQRYFVNHVFVFGCLLGLVSQTLVMYFNDGAVAHLGYFGTDFQIGDRYACFLILYPRTFSISDDGHFIGGRNITDFGSRTFLQERSLEPTPESFQPRSYRTESKLHINAYFCDLSNILTDVCKKSGILLIKDLS
jgi:hypothetical protein